MIYTVRITEKFNDCEPYTPSQVLGFLPSTDFRYLLILSSWL